MIASRASHVDDAQSFPSRLDVDDRIASDAATPRRRPLSPIPRWPPRNRITAAIRPRSTGTASSSARQRWR